jgi:Leucine-rich repeat (LRR) protein
MYASRMRLGSSHYLNGALCALLAASIAAACTGDSQHKNARDSAGGGGAGGEGVPHAGGMGTTPEPVGGNGGAPPVTSAGQGGVPDVINGGAPSAGQGGAVDMLPVVNCNPVTFVDPRLEAAVRNKLGKTTGVITPQDMANLTTLDASSDSIASLDGIECFPNLADINFGSGELGSSITELAPLRYLKKLTKVDLSGNPLKSLEPLGKLPNLQDLSLLGAIHNNLDISSLASAPSLTNLDLGGNSLGDLTPLASIATLNRLALYSSTLAAPATLSALKNVKELVVYNSIGDATPLAAMTQLVTLDVSFNKPLTNFDKLSTLVSLTSLSANDTGIASITALASMTKLTDLTIGYNLISDLAPLQGLTLLTNLSLFQNPTITSITPLVNNAGIGAGAQVDLSGDTVSCADVKTLRNRGATVIDSSCP